MNCLWKRIFLAAIVLSLLLSGCAGNSASKNVSSHKSVTSVNSKGAGGKNSGSKASAPGTVPKLTEKQKTQINVKLNNALDSMDKALKSIQDPVDINVNSN